MEKPPETTDSVSISPGKTKIKSSQNDNKDEDMISADSIKPKTPKAKKRKKPKDTTAPRQPLTGM